jgi:cytochrome oxidase assembly protein ShyY1
MRFFHLYKRFSTSTNTVKPALDKAGIFVFSSITLVTGGLGIWQLQRYDEKIVKIKETKKTLKNDMVCIQPEAITQESLTESLIKHRNQKVNLGKGIYLNEKEVFLGQRSGPSGKLGPKAQGMASNPQVSYSI